MVKAGFMHSRRKLPKWPFEGVTVKVPKKRRERSPGFTTDDAKVILKAAREGLGISPRWADHRQRAPRWIPWICAYSGARVGEIIQLRKQDLREVNGIKFIHITPEAGSTKTGNDRFVPLHEHVLAEGLWDVIEALPPGPVFMPLPTKGQAVNTTPVANRLREWIRDVVGITDTRVQPNHAWRHRFITEARGRMAEFERAIMLERQREGIAKAKAEGKYKGRKPTARAQADQVQRLKAEGLGASEIAEKLGIGRASVYRILAD